MKRRRREAAALARQDAIGSISDARWRMSWVRRGPLSFWFFHPRGWGFVNDGQGAVHRATVFASQETMMLRFDERNEIVEHQSSSVLHHTLVSRSLSLVKYRALPEVSDSRKQDAQQRHQNDQPPQAELPTSFGGGNHDNGLLGAKHVPPLDGSPVISAIPAWTRGLSCSPTASANRCSYRW